MLGKGRNLIFAIHRCARVIKVYSLQLVFLYEVSFSDEISLVFMTGSNRIIQFGVQGDKFIILKIK